MTYYNCDITAASNLSLFKPCSLKKKYTIIPGVIKLRLMNRSSVSKVLDNN